jgi:hypothetical protein
VRRSEFRAEGLGYVLDFPDIATSFHVDRLRVSSGDMKGHVMVRTGLAGARTYADGLIHYSQETLSSSTARKSLSRLLDEKVPCDPKLDWFGMYDEFCTSVMLADRAGKAPDAVGEMPEAAVSRGLLIEPFLPLGVHSILFGDGGLGKSIMAVAMAVSLQTGREIIPGFKPLVTGQTLYLNWETTREDIDARVKSVCAGAGIRPVSLYHLSGGGRPLAQRVEHIARVIEQTAAVMMVVDSNGKAIGASGEGPIEDAANRFSSSLDELDRTALCIDHVSKAGAMTQGGAGKPYGSTMKSNWARATWEMTLARPSEDGDTHLVLHHRKHNTTAEHAPIGLLMRWNRGAVSWEPEDVSDDSLSYGGTVVEMVRAALADHPLRIAEIASRIGRSEPTVKTTLYRTKDMFKRIETGDWMLID